MNETAQILKIEGELVTLSCQAAACASCASKGGCKPQAKTHYQAINPRGLILTPGDTVEVYLAPGRTILAAFMTMIVPLFFFLLGYRIGSTLLPAASEGILVLAGFGGLLTGFALNLLTGKLMKKKSYPEIIKILSPDQGLKATP